MIEDLFRQHRADLAINKRLVVERKALDKMLEQHGVPINDAETFKKKKEKEEAIRSAVRAKTKEVCQNVVEELEVLREHPDEEVAGTTQNAKKLIALLQEMVVANSLDNQTDE